MFDVLGNLDCSFGCVDVKRFPLLELVLDAARCGGNAMAVVNAADEVAIDYFLREKISFPAMYDALEHTYARRTKGTIKTFKDVVRWDAWSRTKTKEYIEKKCC